MTTSMFAIRGSKTASCAVVGVGAVLAVGACSSKSSNPTPTVTQTVAPTVAPAAAAPAPPGSAELGAGKAGGINYKNASMSPSAVKNYYVTALQNTGYSIIKNTSNGGGGGGYGGSGAGVIGSKGSSFVGVGAGGETGHTTYFSVCSGASQASVNVCYDNEQNNNNSNSGGS